MSRTRPRTWATRGRWRLRPAPSFSATSSAPPTRTATAATILPAPLARSRPAPPSRARSRAWTSRSRSPACACRSDRSARNKKPRSPGAFFSPCLLSARRFGEQRPAAEARVYGRRPAFRDFHRTVLELRDLPDRIEHGVREQIGGRLVVTERDKHRADRRAVVGARVQRNLSAARFHRDDITRLGAHLVEVERME